jgi:hypothetical protein
MHAVSICRLICSLNDSFNECKGSKKTARITGTSSASMKTSGHANPNNPEAAISPLRRPQPHSGPGGTHESRVDPTPQDRVIDLPHGDGASRGFTFRRSRPCAREPAFDDYDPLCIVDRVEADQYVARSCPRDRTAAENGAPSDAPEAMGSAGGRQKMGRDSASVLSER